jgi:hypothetical protein
MDIKQKIPVLFILMEFAPVNTTGNFRSLKIIKYIQEYGIEPIILTFPQNQASSFFNAKIDEDLMEDLPKNLLIYRISSDPIVIYNNKFLNSLKIYFSTEDELAKRWENNLRIQLQSIIDKHQPRVIFTSLPPFSSGGMAARISIKFGLPLIIDMRDLWAGWSSPPKNSFLHFKNILFKEKYIFKSASKIICVTPQLIETFNALHINKFENKFVYIPNSFDKDICSVNPFYSILKSEIIIGYVGSFYYNPPTYKRLTLFKFHQFFKYQPIKEDWLYRSPFYFFSTLVILFKIKPDYKTKIKIEFIGKTPFWLVEMIKAFDLTDNVSHHGFVSSKKSIEIQKKFDYFLATSEKIIGKDHYCLPSKLFDYVGANKPILGFVTNGIQKDFIEKSNLGKIFNPDNINESALNLDIYLSQDKLIVPNRNYLEQFTSKNISNKIAETIKVCLRKL